MKTLRRQVEMAFIENFRSNFTDFIQKIEIWSEWKRMVWWLCTNQWPNHFSVFRQFLIFFLSSIHSQQIFCHTYTHSLPLTLTKIIYFAIIQSISYHLERLWQNYISVLCCCCENIDHSMFNVTMSHLWSHHVRRMKMKILLVCTLIHSQTPQHIAFHRRWQHCCSNLFNRINWNKPKLSILAFAAIEFNCNGTDIYTCVHMNAFMFKSNEIEMTTRMSEGGGVEYEREVRR